MSNPPPPCRRWRKMTSDDRMFRDWPCDECAKKAFFLHEEGEGNHLRTLSHKCLDHVDFETLTSVAIEAFRRLSPEDQAKHRRDQAVSWVFGNLRLDGIDISKEQVEKLLGEKKIPFTYDRDSWPQSPG